MREEYDYLTDATRDGLTDHAKAAAAGWGKAISYIYSILQNEKKDPFACFRSFYEGLCEGGVSTATWDNDLAYLRQKHDREARPKETNEAVQLKFQSQNEFFSYYMNFISDGHLSLEEVGHLEMLLDTDDAIKTGVRSALRAHRANLERQTR